MKITEAAVEKMLAKKDAISNATIQAALKKVEQQKQEKLEAKLLENLEKVQKVTENAVSTLKMRRKQAEKAKKYLVAVAEAEQQFYKDADINAYDKALQLAVKLL